MNIDRPTAQKADIRPTEFVVAVIVGSVGSGVLSALHVHALYSVGFALLTMGMLAWFRWGSVAKHKDFESLESFSEDVYLLGYLLTLSALLGLAPRLMSEDTNLFNIAGLKLVTTVVGLALMMIFRQIARRWAQDRIVQEEDEWQRKQAIFSEAVDRLNHGADSLTAKLDEVVRRFDPELLTPVAEWSNRAAQAFSQATTHLEAVPPSVLNGIRHLDALNANLEQVKTTAAELASVLTAGTAQAASVLSTELGNASQAAASLGSALSPLTTATHAAKGGVEQLGTSAATGATEMAPLGEHFQKMALELAKVERALKKLSEADLETLNLPVNRLAQAVETAGEKANASGVQAEGLKGELQGVTTASRELANRLGLEVGRPLQLHQETLLKMQESLAQATERMTVLVKQLEHMGVNDQGVNGFGKELLARLSGLEQAMTATNVQLKTLVNRADGAAGPDHKTSFFGLFGSKR